MDPSLLLTLFLIGPHYLRIYHALYKKRRKYHCQGQLHLHLNSHSRQTNMNFPFQTVSCCTFATVLEDMSILVRQNI